MRGVPAEGGSEAYLRVRRSAAQARQSAYGGQMGLFEQPARIRCARQAPPPEPSWLRTMDPRAS